MVRPLVLGVCCVISIHLDASEDDSLGLEVDAAPHGVDHRLGLLEDLLLHERREVALHDLLDLHLQSRDLPENY